MSLRHIVIAASREDVVIVTPRSPHGARGMIADAITVTTAMQGHPATPRLLAECEPALATVPRRTEGAWDAMITAELEAARYTIAGVESESIIDALETLADRGPVSRLEAASLRLAGAIVRRSVSHGQ